MKGLFQYYWYKQVFKLESIMSNKQLDKLKKKLISLSYHVILDYCNVGKYNRLINFKYVSEMRKNYSRNIQK